MFTLDPITILIRALVLVTAMPVHECAHGLVADKLGDHTARSAGRLTLNPFHHLDLTGSLLLLLAGFGWAKPVPVNPYYFTKIRNRKAGIALTALAGPVSNLLMALVAMLIAKGLLLLPVSGTAVSFLFTIFLVVCQTNLGLAVFNLIPIHPLDGSRVLDAYLPFSWSLKIQKYQPVIILLFIFALWRGWLDIIMSRVAGQILSLAAWFVGLFL